jgi:hypothetical protein
MNLPSFPIPNPKPDYGVAAQRVQALQDVLGYVVQTMAGGVDAGMSAIQQDLDAATRTLMRSANGRVNGLARQVDQVVSPLIQAAAVGAAETVINGTQAMQQLQSAAAAVPAVTSQPGCPPPTNPDGTLYTGPSVTGTLPGDEFMPSQPAPGQTIYWYIQPTPGYSGPSLFTYDYGVVCRYLSTGMYSVLVRGVPGPTPVPPPPVTTPPPPPPPDQTLWYCGLRADGTRQTISSIGPLSPAIASQFVTMAGPFADSITAANSCPTVVGQPPPPTQPPPEPPLEQPPSTVTPIFLSSSVCSGDFCSRMLALRDSLVQLGDTLLAQASSTDVEPYISLDWFHGLFTAMVDYSSAVQDAINKASYVISQVRDFRVISAYIDRLRLCGITGTWEVARLLAVRGVLIHIGSTDFGVSYSGSKGSNVGANIGLSAGFSGGMAGELVQTAGPVSQSGVLGLHGGSSIGISGGTGVSSSVSVSTNLFVVPLIEVIDVLIRWSGAWLPLGPDAATRCYLAGQISKEDLRCRVEMAGISYDEWDTYVYTQHTRPGHLQAERLFRAGKIDEAKRSNYYSLSGIRDEEDAKAFVDLYQQYPPFQDVISFMVRDVFDPAVAPTLDPEDEFSKKYVGEALKLGSIAGLDPETARLYWMAHWQQPASNLLFAMMHRLRPGKVDAKLVVTQADVAKQLAINDMAPAWRDKLVAISYNEISIRQARQLYQNYVISQDDVEDVYLNQGYYPERAKAAAVNEAIVKIRARASQSHGWTPAALSTGYAYGKVNSVFVRQEMLRQGWTIEEAKALEDRAGALKSGRVQLRAESRAISSSWAAILTAYKVGSVDQATATDLLLRHGWSMDSIGVALAAEDVKSRQVVVAQALTVVRRSYLSGEIDEAALSNQLTLIGVSPIRIAEYVTTWRLQLTPRRKTLAGQQVLRLFGEGLLTEEESRLRLNRLGWGDPDLSLLILETRNKREQAAARALKASDQNRVKAASLVAKEVKAQQTLLKETQSRLCHMVPVPRLIKWFARHWIELPYLEERLVTCGYTRDVIDGYLLEALDARDKEDKKAEKAIDKLRSAPRSSAANGAGSAGTANPGATTG